MSGSRCQQRLAVGDPRGPWRKAWVGLQARPKASTSVLGRWPRARDRCSSLLGLRQVPPQGRHYLSGSWPHPVGLRVESRTQGVSPSGFQSWDPSSLRNSTDWFPLESTMHGRKEQAHV